MSQWLFYTYTDSRVLFGHACQDRAEKRILKNKLEKEAGKHGRRIIFTHNATPERRRKLRKS